MSISLNPQLDEDLNQLFNLDAGKRIYSITPKPSPKMLEMRFSDLLGSSFSKPFESKPGNPSFSSQVPTVASDYAWSCVLELRQWPAGSRRKILGACPCEKLYIYIYLYGSFLKWWVSPTNPWVFLLKMISTWGVKWGETHHLRKHPYIHIMMYGYSCALC